MKILIVSDTHKKNENYFKVLEMHHPDMVIHCGDAEGSEYALSAAAQCPVYIVLGNNDFFSDLPREITLDIGDYKVWVTHGHNYYVSMGNETIKKEAIDRGVDMMDCVMPTRNGRNGMLFTQHGIMNMRNKKWADDFSPLQEDGASIVDKIYSKAYVRHLFVAQEILAMQIASVHNLAFYLWLVGEARKHIIEGDFKSWKNEMVERVTRRL